MDIQDMTMPLLASTALGSIYGALVAQISTRQTNEPEVWLAYLNVVVVVGIVISLQTTMARHLGLMLFFPALIGVALGYVVRLMCLHATHKSIADTANGTDLSKPSVSQ